MHEVIRQKFYVHLLLSPCMSCVEYMIVTAEVATYEKRNGEIILFYTLICLESNKSLIVIMYVQVDFAGHVEALLHNSNMPCSFLRICLVRA
jgi:hypothetical protein